MMNERGKSDPAVVATKLANKAERSAAEPVEPRAGTKGNANQQHTGRTQSRETVSQVLARIRQTAKHDPACGQIRRRSGIEDALKRRAEARRISSLPGRSLDCGQLIVDTSTGLVQRITCGICIGSVSGCGAHRRDQSESHAAAW